MQDKPLLLLHARSADSDPAWALWLRRVAVVIGILMVVIGLADVSSRLAQAVAGDGALFDAFAPAAALKPAVVPEASASSTALAPARLKVPSLGIDAVVEEVGKKADGSMGTPRDFMKVGFYAPGAKPGAAGSAVMAGHVNNALTEAGVFAHLSQIQKGDYVTVSDAAGRTLVYQVAELRLFDADEAPAASLFATSGPSQLVLITCEGEWIESERGFDKRLVVIAKPAY
ncbi:MAG: sortase [Candidatus Adlerbacteria bacterium]|nr:sortase [Candidatus Adlerbacteria bacterium]